MGDGILRKFSLTHQVVYFKKHPFAWHCRRWSHEIEQSVTLSKWWPVYQDTLILTFPPSLPHSLCPSLLLFGILLSNKELVLEIYHKLCLGETELRYWEYSWIQLDNVKFMVQWKHLMFSTRFVTVLESRVSLGNLSI